MKISLILAVAENGVIGKNGKTPWHITSDLKHFKKITEGHHVLMGRKTYESIGRPLPKRTNLVLTRDPNFLPEGCIVFKELEEALEFARTNGEEELIVIGGEEIYKLAEPLAHRIYMTRVHREYEGDRAFTFGGGWKVVETERHFDEDPPFQYLVLEPK